MGLLGTVNGMIATFASLHGATTLSGSEATVASGISLALASTQLGLAVGVPGLVAMRMLERREASVRRALYQAKAVLGGGE
ncbi:MAG: MotA/TolQ/ExbB proton channel family protein [Myxococcota bacterium]